MWTRYTISTRRWESRYTTFRDMIAQSSLELVYQIRDSLGYSLSDKLFTPHNKGFVAKYYGMNISLEIEAQ